MSQPIPAVRLTSVDVFRGATMAAMVIVNTPGNWGQVYAPLLHADWHGWTPTDLIFPFFVFIVGVSIVLSSRSRGSALVILKRAALLYALGLFLALYPYFNVSTVRVVGVLPRLAVCYLAAALAYRTVSDRGDARRWQVPLGAAAVLLAGYWALVTWVPAPGGIAGDLTPSGNLGAWIDRTLIGEAHLWKSSKTWDPEGLLSTLPAIATALTGVAAGVVLRTTPGVETPGVPGLQTRGSILLAAGLLATIAGLAWGTWFPINKNLWTSSYVLFTSGLASIVLALCHWLVDSSDTGRRLARPLVVLGTNALALFVFSGLLVKTLILVRLTGQDGGPVSLYNWIFQHAFAPFASPKNASLLFALTALALLYALLEVMYRKRWFLKV